MNLPILQKITSLVHKTPKSEFFVVYLIESKLIKVAVWEKMGRKIKVIKIVKEEFSGSLEELIEISDRAISKASFGIPAEKLNRVVFSVPIGWADQGKIQANYLKFLKNICVSLSLSPLGFVITTEAIVKQFESTEASHINFILCHVANEILNISYIEHGEVKEAVSSLRVAGNIGDDFIEILGRFKTPSLPNKILIFDGVNNLDEIKQEILKTPLTQKEKRFLHFPSVELLEENADVLAVIRVVGRELGASFEGEELILPREPEVQEENKPKEKETIKETIAQKAEELKPEEIQPTLKEEAREESPSEIDDSGFVYGRDIAETVYEKPKELVAEKPVDEPKQKLALTDFSLKKGVFAIGGFCLGLIVIFLIYWFYFSRGELILNVKTSNFKDEVKIPLVNTTTSKADVLQGEEIVLSVSGTKEVAVTGKKKTGDKATGEVVVFNKNTDAEKTFNKGTVISNGDLKFTLDDNVKIASASMQTEAGQETKIFGKATVKVTAEKFGNEYNLGDNKDFTVDNYAQSSFSAHNDRAFSGGTTREVQVASEKDRGDLLKSLQKDLENKAKAEAKNKINVETQDILNTFISIKVIEKKFSADANEEAKKLSLALTIECKTYAYKKEDAKKILEKILSSKIPSGYFLDQNSIKLILQKAVEADDGYNLTFGYEVRAIPKINLKETASRIKGSYIPGLGKYLNDTNIKDYQVNVWPKLPGIFYTMPHREENIKIKLKY